MEIKKQVTIDSIKKILLVTIGLALVVTGLSAFEILKNNFIKKESAPTTTAEVTKHVTDIIQTEDPKAAWEYLQKNFIDRSGNQTVTNGRTIDLHFIAHQIGGAFYKSYGENGISFCDSSFTYGCYHGFIAGMLSTEGVQSITKVDALCAQSPNKETCIHGVGHGLSDLKGLDFGAALEACNTFKSIFAHACGAGVFMEYHQNIRGTESAPKAESWSPCTEVSSPYQAACAESKPEFLSSSYNKDTVSISNFCASAATKEMTEACMKELAFVIVRRNGNDTQKILTECASVDKAYKDSCFTNAAELTDQQRLSGWEASVQTLCANVYEKTEPPCNHLTPAR